MTVCVLPDCSRPATVMYRMLPRRTDDPVYPEIMRALVWPGMALACSVPACHEHAQTVKDAATTVLAETPLGDAEPAVRGVGGEEV